MKDQDFIFLHNDIEYVRLYQADPICLERGIHFESDDYYWYHGDNNCGGEIWLGDNCHLLCKKCMQDIPLPNALWASPSTIVGVSENQIYFNGNIGYKILSPLSVTGAALYERHGVVGLFWLNKLVKAAIELYGDSNTQ